MERTPLVAGLSQPFVRLGTLRGMSDVAGKLAVARKAVAEVRDVENRLLTSTVNQEQMNAAMRDTAELAGMAASATDDAIGVLSKMRADVERFIAMAERELAGRVTEVEDATD